LVPKTNVLPVTPWANLLMRLQIYNKVLFGQTFLNLFIVDFLVYKIN
jgi:hypothetical protein